MTGSGGLVAAAPVTTTMALSCIILVEYHDFLIPHLQSGRRRQNIAVSLVWKSRMLELPDGEKV